MAKDRVKMHLSRVLVVDDYEPFRNFLCQILAERKELQVVAHASDGIEAVEKTAQLQPDLILLDLGLPRLNGIEAAQQIRTLAPRSRILFVSQESSPDIVQAALDAGGLGYIHKPGAVRDLLHAIDSVLAGKQFVSCGLRVHAQAKS